jgi:hypothetical protein
MLNTGNYSKKEEYVSNEKRCTTDKDRGSMGGGGGGIDCGGKGGGKGFPKPRR